MVCGRVNSSRARARRRPPTTVLRGPCVASELAGRSELVRQGGEPLPRGRTRLARCWQRRRWPACSGVPPGLSSCCECARSEPSAASSYQVVYTPLGRSRRPQRAHRRTDRAVANFSGRQRNKDCGLGPESAAPGIQHRCAEHTVNSPPLPATETRGKLNSARRTLRAHGDSRARRHATGARGGRAAQCHGRRHYHPRRHRGPIRRSSGASLR